MKFVYICDVHYGHQPISRKDNYNESILNKLKQVFNYAVENSCFVVIGGDLFDRPLIKMEELIKLTKLFNNYPTLKFNILYGNYSHDGHPANSPLNFLSLLQNVKINDIVEDEEFLMIPCPNGSLPEEVEVPYSNSSKKKILLTHDTIVKTPIIFDHILFEDLKTESDFIFLAHYHPYQGLTEINGKIFYGCGALSRRKRISHDVSRKLLFAEFDKGIIKEIDLDYELDVWTNKEFKNDESFDEELLKSIELMKHETANSNFIEIANFEDLLKEYCKSIEYNTEVVEYIFKNLKNYGN
jgi:DNA repair exonuclease SbcCD nuclease subunit